jgi:peptidoglycan/xylan/chitin deacetylase (PgdA/CDA1 family)
MSGYIMRSAKSLTEIIFAFLYSPVLFLRHEGPLRIVIYYHSVAKKDLASFSKQMAYLARNCYVVRPSEIKTARPNGADVIVAVTFDDAFISFVENAVPVLRKHGLPAGVFVPTGCLERKPSWEMPDNCPDKDETIMDAEQIIELDKKGYEIFSHTISHSMLTREDDKKLEEELVESKKHLQKITGHEISIISYPYGAHNAKVREAAKRAGYKFGFSIEPQIVNHSSDDMSIGRFKVLPGDNLIKFKLKINGGYEGVMYLRRLKRLFMRVPVAEKV